ncbi:MAG: nucleotidyltransferase family protein [Deltaproteobacteria bacterium]
MIGGLILAAGGSSRMGQDKALLDFRGRSFLETAVVTLRSAGAEPIVVVLGHHEGEIRRAVNLEGAKVVINENYSLGQTSSLQTGLRALAGSKVEAVVLWLVDHPAVSAETVARLITEFRKSSAPVVIPRYRGERGHPVMISRVLFEELFQLAPGQAGNTVIRKHRGETAWIDVDDPGVRLDIDDPEEYRNLKA